MTQFKNSLISAYRTVTQPWRSIRMKMLKRSGQVPVSILFYHRVADDSPNEWTISRAGFEEQIDWLQKNFDIVSLDECQRRIRSGFNQRPTVAITFDDGYAENCEFGLSLLIERRIPVTYFVTMEHPTSGDAFPHDIELGDALPPNSIEALRALSKAGVEIGGHTRNHADLGAINDLDQLHDEVITASAELASLVDQPIRYFAFPYGQFENLNPKAFEMLEQAGFAGVCSAYNSLNQIGGNGFHLQRVHGDPNIERIKNWLTLDPRMAWHELYDWRGKLREMAGDASAPQVENSTTSATSLEKV